MKQIPYTINTIKDLQDCVEQVREESRKLNVSSILVSVFADTAKKNDAGGYSKEYLVRVP